MLTKYKSSCMACTIIFLGPRPDMPMRSNISSSTKTKLVQNLFTIIYSGGHILKAAPPRSGSMTYVTNYVINLSDLKVKRGTRCSLLSSID
uniref:Secreted protein n=1 Tax=Heterorhabditis bacteriophora TaxID=37862 RepID=A0A1I7XB73_HETBA